jgi:hypothetical protein
MLSIMCMRTTLSLDDDILFAIKERARREKRSAGDVLSDLARQALTGATPKAIDPEVRNGFPILPHRGVVVTRALIDSMREDEGE